MIITKDRLRLLTLLMGISIFVTAGYVPSSKISLVDFGNDDKQSGKCCGQPSPQPPGK